MKTHNKYILALFLISCTEPFIQCDCAMGKTADFTFFDGSDSTKIVGLQFIINDLNQDSFEVRLNETDSSYSVFANSGNFNFKFIKEGYDTLSLNNVSIDFVDDGCCGEIKSKSFQLKMVKSSVNN